MDRKRVERAYLDWFKHTDDPQIKLEIARLAAGAFDDEEYPSDEVIELLVEKENWVELKRLRDKFGRAA
jgi:hypothetical protein